MEIAETIKQHPVASVAVLAVGFLVLYMAMGSGSAPAAAASTGPSDTLQAAELNSATQLQMAQIGAQSTDNQTAANATLGALALNAGLLGKYSDNDTAFKIADLNAGVAKDNITAQQAVALGQQKQVTDIAAITSAVNVAGIQANASTSLASIQAQADTARLISNNSASVAKNSSNNSLFGNILGIGASLLSFL